MRSSTKDSLSLIVTAAGEGKRLKPITPLIPKCFLPVAFHDGDVECAVLRLIRQFRSAGVERVCLAVSEHLWFEELSRQRSDLAAVVAEPLGEWSAVRTCVERHEIRGPVIIASGDNVLSDRDVEEFVSRAKGRPAVPCLVGGGFEESTARYTRLEVSGAQVRDLVEKPDDAGPGIAKAGIYYLDVSSLRWAMAAPQRRDRFGELSMTEILVGLIDNGIDVVCHTLEEGFCDIGSVDGLERATLRAVGWRAAAEGL